MRVGKLCTDSVELTRSAFAFSSKNLRLNMFNNALLPSYYQTLEVRLDEHCWISVIAVGRAHLQIPHALSIAYLFACGL